jgi:peptidyl-prolyl cis-trans isomerase SurA
MKKIILTSLLLCCAFCTTLSLAKSNSESLDKIIAVVNDDVITTSELQQSLAIVKLQIAQQNGPAPSENILKKQVLDQLISKKLQLQIAKQAGIGISDTDLDRAIETIAKQNNATTEMLYERLNADGMSTTDYRREIRDQLTLQKLQQQEVVSRISITPDEVTSFMRSQLWQNNGAKEYRIEDILIPLSDAPSSSDIATARKHALLVIDQLNAGKNFREVAQSESGAKNALDGGDLGWRKLPEIPSAFAEQVSRMQTKEIAGPIQTPNGFHIIRLSGMRKVGSEEPAPSRKEVEDLLMQRKFEEAVQGWISKLRSQAFIETSSTSKNELA